MPASEKQAAALFRNCIKSLSGALRGGCILAASCAIAVGIQAPASALITRGSSIYKIVDGPLWTQAETNAVNLGGNLATINDANENYFVAELAPFATYPLYKGVWIGGNDVGAEGVWEWSSGQDFSYTNWITGRPDNEFGGQDYLFLIGDRQEYGGLFFGMWDDGNPQPNFPSLYAAMGVAEIPFQSFNGYAYVRVQGTTLQDAVANALELGGTIVDNSDATENAWLASAFSGEPTDRIARIPFSGSSASVPGPLPLFGAATAFGFSRKLRRRIAAS